MLEVTNNAGLFCRALLGTLIALALALNASAQTFPLKDKPITIVVPFSAGGPTDRLAREMAEGLRKPFGGANIVVENILGAGGAIATQKVAKAAPDGHTILIHHIGMATMLVELLRNGDTELAQKIRDEDDKVDALHLSVFETVLSDTWSGGTETTVDATLASRYLERFADHAVSIAKKMVYLATGEWNPQTGAIKL
jgi:hypothetical protein